MERVLNTSPTPLFDARIDRYDITRDTAGRITVVKPVGVPGSTSFTYKANGVQLEAVTLATPALARAYSGQCWCDSNCALSSRECEVERSPCSNSGGPPGQCRVWEDSTDVLTQSFEYDARALPSARTVRIHPGAILPGYEVGDFTYEYDPVGRNTVVTYPGGHVRTQVFDALGRLTSRCYAYADGSPEHCYTAQYDAVGNPVLLTDPDMRREIDYDDLDRVTAVRRFVPPSATTPTHVETYVYNALGGFSVYDGVAMDDRRPRLDGNGTASAGVSASLNGEPVPLDGGGRVTALQGQTFQYYKADHRLKAILGPRNTLFIYDALGRLMQTHSQNAGAADNAPGAREELFYYNGTNDSIAAEAQVVIHEPTPSDQPREPPPRPDRNYQIIYDGLDQPLWIVRGTETALYELDTTGNVRRLHAGQRFSGGYPDGDDPDYKGDLGGYAYTAFGKSLAGSDVGDLHPPTRFPQPFTWQGKRQLGANLYYSRARIWSAELGTFLQPDQYVYLTPGGTLWSWPGQNPFRWRDPTGRGAAEQLVFEGLKLLEGLATGTAANANNVAALSRASALPPVAATLAAAASLGVYWHQVQGLGYEVFEQQDASANAIAKAAARARAAGGGNGKEPPDDTDCDKKGSKIDRAAFRKTRQDFWRAEARSNPSAYSQENLQRMAAGKAPIGSDRHPMELHHIEGTPEGRLQPLTRTEHRLGENYLKNHPWLRGDP